MGKVFWHGCFLSCLIWQGEREAASLKCVCTTQVSCRRREGGEELHRDIFLHHNGQIDRPMLCLFFSSPGELWGGGVTRTLWYAAYPPPSSPESPIQGGWGRRNISVNLKFQPINPVGTGASLYKNAVMRRGARTGSVVGYFLGEKEKKCILRTFGNTIMEEGGGARG